jgi:hypothetical protein
MWYGRKETFLLSLDIVKSNADTNFYYKILGTTIVFIFLYVDDLLITGNNESTVRTLQLQLTHKFAMIDLGNITRYLGIQFHRTHHALSILQLAHMFDNRPTYVPMAEGMVIQRSMQAPPFDGCSYRQLVGKLLYLTNMHPDLAFAVGVTRHFMHDPEEPHLELVRNILRYICRYLSTGLTSQRGRITAFRVSPMPIMHKMHMIEFLQVSFYSRLYSHFVEF